MEAAGKEEREARERERQEAEPKKAEAGITNEVREAICPVCGKGISLQHRKGLRSYLGNFDRDKPFGVVLDNRGGRYRGYRFVGYFNPQDDTDGIFELVKGRLLQAVREWVVKGWITEEELKTLS